jgi:hypothetical protein
LDGLAIRIPGVASPAIDVVRVPKAILPGNNPAGTAEITRKRALFAAEAGNRTPATDSTGVSGRIGSGSQKDVTILASGQNYS